MSSASWTLFGTICLTWILAIVGVIPWVNAIGGFSAVCALELVTMVGRKK